MQDKAIVDIILRPHCTLPSPFPANNVFSRGKKTHSRPQAMRPIVNMPKEDRATDIGNMHKKSGKDRACGSGDILADGQTHRQTDRPTDRQTDILITILRSKHMRSFVVSVCTAWRVCNAFAYRGRLYLFIYSVVSLCSIETAINGYSWILLNCTE